MGDPTSNYATAGIAVRVLGALKPHHHDKVETPSVGKLAIIRDNLTHKKALVKTLALELSDRFISGQ
jgi:hypothetical protein